MPLTYITYTDLARDVVSLAAKLPRDLVGIVGVPRSGMIPAAMLATHLHLPLAEVREFADSGGKWFDSGHRLNPFFPGSGKVLVVDDSLYKGGAMNKARKHCAASEPFPSNAAEWFDFEYAAIYRWPQTEAKLDYWARDVEAPRYFEWNLFNHPDLAGAMLDIDGVLCVDPPVFDDDGLEYVAALENAVPLHIPCVPVHTLISCRLERWRPQTEAWLARHGVRYSNLILSQHDTADERRRVGRYGQFKGRHYRVSPCTLFIESDAEQAPHIAETSGKPVICLADGKVYQ